jgi:hypothetical protein
MSSKRNNIILAAALLLSLYTKAQFRHKASLDSIRKTGFYSLAVTPELSSHLKLDLSDLRIIDEKKQWVPYITEMPFHKKGITPVLFDQKITQKANSGSETILIIENTGKQELSNFIIELRSAAAERIASLSGSDDNKDWFVILDSLLLRESTDYSHTSYHQRVNFPASTYQYFKLTIHNNNKGPLNILAAKSSEIILPADTIQPFFNNPAPAFVQTDSGDYSLVKIIHDRPFQISSIRLRISNPSFYKRQAKVFTTLSNSLPATWYSRDHHAFTISSDDFSEHTIQLLKSDTLYLLIENGDNPPLQVSSLATGVINRSVIAYLEKGKSYSLWLDNPQGSSPVYDLQHFKDRIIDRIPLSIRTITPLTQPEPAGPQKQTGKRWIWPVTILVMMLLSILTWKLATDMKKNTADQLKNPGA